METKLMSVKEAIITAMSEEMRRGWNIRRRFWNFGRNVGRIWRREN